MKVTTEDCRALIVETIKNRKDLITGNWSGEDAKVLLDAAINPKNWKRTRKVKPTEKVYYTLHHKKIDASEVECVRDFFLNPSEFEEAVGFEVLQLKTGTLVMGMDIGD